MNLKKTAILLFAQSAQKEAANKPFKNATRLFTQLNNHTIAIVKKSKLPYFRLTEEQQVGSTFGERLTNAIQSIYDKGYDHVIAIGNDTPHLQTHHILDTAKKLETHSLVLGPSKDGGFYLIGLHKSQFNPTEFLQLPWQSQTLTKELLIAYSLRKEKIQTHLLETLEDIDLFIDIKIILKGLRALNNHIIQQLLEAIVYTKTTVYTQKIPFINSFSRRVHHNKGSPTFLPL
ncbi:DUF2064 domain-containing protein [Dokdonia ponticola]|uniref:DUF2064 domain-containing protein n=1 Tax=Dokdonia ponticola TaxID=2041041 RepID=A0ABV9HXW7_9FLAO